MIATNTNNKFKGEIPLSGSFENGGYRILFIEDDVFDQLAFKRFVKKEELDYSFQTAGSVSEALEILESEPFDLILTDHNLGDGTAFDIIDKAGNVPVIFVTAGGDEEIAAKAMRNGAYDYLIKDQDYNYLQVLPLTVQNAINHNRSAAKLKESEERFRDLFESTSDLIQYIGDQGNFIYVNTAWKERLGYTELEMESMTIANVLMPDCLNDWQSIHKKALAGERINDFDLELVSKNGDPLIVRGNITSYNESGTLLTRSILRDVTAQMQFQTKLRAQHDKLEEQNKDITDSIRYAQHIQRAYLPDIELLKAYYPDSFIYLKPRDIVSGDFYWMASVGDKFVMAMADCTGHGVPGGFITILGMTLLNSIVKDKGVTDPGLILTHLHAGFRISLSDSMGNKNIGDGMDISICTIDPSNQQLEFAGARRPLYFHSNNELQTVKGNKASVGETIGQSVIDFTTHQLSYEPGDAIYLFSDGFPDQFGGSRNKKFSSARFHELIKGMTDKKMAEQETLLDTSLTDWIGEVSQIDDILVIGMRL